MRNILLDYFSKYVARCSTINLLFIFIVVVIVFIVHGYLKFCYNHIFLTRFTFSEHLKIRRQIRTINRSSHLHLLCHGLVGDVKEPTSVTVRK